MEEAIIGILPKLHKNNVIGHQNNKLMLIVPTKY